MAASCIEVYDLSVVDTNASMAPVSGAGLLVSLPSCCMAVCLLVAAHAAKDLGWLSHMGPVLDMCQFHACWMATQRFGSVQACPAD